jgi:hypothetical protein
MRYITAGPPGPGVTPLYTEPDPGVYLVYTHRIGDEYYSVHKQKVLEKRNKKRVIRAKAQSTWTWSTTVYIDYIPLLKSKLPHAPPSAASLPRNQKGGGGTLACGWGDGGVPIPTTWEKA